MKKDKNKTKVQFLVDKEGKWPPFAYFPEEIADRQQNRISYAHVGQHSACSPEYVAECREATKKERQSLIEELESIGYRLDII